MIRTENVNRVVRHAAPPRTALWAARIRGWRDGRRGLPHVPPPTDIPLGPGTVVTAFVREQRATADRAVEQLRSRMLDRERRLITGIRYQAVHVVEQYDGRSRPAPAALARFGERVGEWRAKADVCRCRAVAVTERANQVISCYWDAVRRYHRDVPDPAPAHLAHWAPARLELDVSWRESDSWLVEPATGRTSVTARALEILDTRPTAGRTRGGR
ncbi:hypothetical protein [Streptomyces millisiae]|uniref:Uncharacterized protein n=1 Tax=Streptomyces millisiae TaxID=3075542 RepID=A0ABU2LN12_9ACTN|nr:hypothetical protein [Streptomyces sp. DSM 44918]MDT0318974.1 hypothetical protein [Streptomyces sp. DSM 44918]